ncbi:MAG: hypothetical protein QOJ03_1168 [Frankiaceae bacterium]|nr:hypothetical protein [Frankiaceae bacterium]
MTAALAQTDLALSDPALTDPAGTPHTGIVEHPADKLARLVAHYDGLAFLQAIKSGELPPAPIAELLGFEIRQLAPGAVTFALNPDEKHYNPIGTVHGGVAATLLDTVMGCALHSLLPQGVGYTTLDISVRYLRPITVQTHTVWATGTVTHHGRRTATAEGRIVAADTGSLLATATSTLLVVRP